MTTLLANKSELSSLSDAKVGDKLEFFYYGHGKHSQSYRRVEVLEINSTSFGSNPGVLAFDLDHDGPRQFLDKEAREVYVLDKPEGVNEISFINARTALVNLGIVSESIVNSLNAEQLGAAYKEYFLSDLSEQGVEVTFDEDRGCLVITENKPEVKTGYFEDFESWESNADCFVSTLSGQQEILKITVDDHAQGTGRLFFAGEQMETPEQLRDALIEFLA